MFTRSKASYELGDIAPMAEALADAFEDVGDQRASQAILSLARKHGMSDRVALRRAEQFFAVGDANEALNALIPPWEAGSPDKHLEAQMGLASLALGLYDVVETLTDQDEYGLENSVLRFLNALTDDLDVPLLDWNHSETVFTAVTMLRILAQCGRTDIVYRVRCYAEDNSLERVLRAISSLPATEPMDGSPYCPPSHGREDFCHRWETRAGDIVFNWAWSSARQVFAGERVCVVSQKAQNFASFFEHTRCVFESTSYCAIPGLNDEHRLAPGRFEHILSVFDLNQSFTPLGVFADYARGLTHEGQLHLLVGGPAIAGDFDLTYSVSTLKRLCEASGLTFLGADSRDESGLPAEPENAAVHLLRAEKRTV